MSFGFTSQLGLMQLTTGNAQQVKRGKPMLALLQAIGGQRMGSLRLLVVAMR